MFLISLQSSYSLFLAFVRDGMCATYTIPSLGFVRFYRKTDTYRSCRSRKVQPENAIIQQVPLFEQSRQVSIMGYWILLSLQPLTVGRCGRLTIRNYEISLTPVLNTAGMPYNTYYSNGLYCRCPCRKCWGKSKQYITVCSTVVCPRRSCSTVPRVAFCNTYYFPAGPFAQP